MHNLKNIFKKFYICFIICILVFVNCVIVKASEVIEPGSNQYFELVAREIKDVSGENKQVLMELWGYDIDFKGFEVRFEYDETQIKPSNISTNELTTDATKYFSYENEFKTSLDFMQLEYDGRTDVMDWVVSFNPPVSSSEHIIDDSGGNKIITTSGGVKLGTVSFQMLTDTFDITQFKLVPDSTYSPYTGIKINLNIINSFENTSTFRFRDGTASKDADLLDLIISSGNRDDSTYKQYDLAPGFDKDTLNYKLDLKDNVDYLNIKPVLSDTKSTIKLKIPKRDDEGKLVYEEDGITILYEEIEITNNMERPIMLNKSGEPNTKISVVVTAENGTDKKEYALVIEKSFAILKGKVYTAPTDGVGIFTATIRLFKTEDVSKIIDWDVSEVSGDDYHTQIMTLTHESFNTNSDGTFEIQIPPGTYDILVDKPGYLDYVFVSKELIQGTPTDLGEISLDVGDLDKDAIVGPRDMGNLQAQYGTSSSADDFEYDYDFDMNGEISGRDVAFISNNYAKVTRTVIK